MHLKLNQSLNVLGMVVVVVVLVVVVVVVVVVTEELFKPVAFLIHSN